MKLNLLSGVVLLAAVFQQGESSITRNVVEQVLTALNTEGGKLANLTNDYFIEKLKNETQIQEWSVDIQVKVLAGIADAAFSVFNILNNASIIDVKLLDCVAEQEPALLAAISKAASDNGWCNNKLAANLTRAFQGVSKLMVERNVEFKTYLNSLESCIWGDNICFTQYLTKVVAYITSEFGEGDTMLYAVQQVIAVYKVMFGQDVPACSKEYLFPEIFDGIHLAFVGVFQCMAS